MVVDTLLVPLDGSADSERAVPVALTLARRLGGEVVLLTTRLIDDNPDAGAYLERVASTCAVPHARLLPVTNLVAADAILDAVQREPRPLVCMATHGRGAATTLLTGSVAGAVLRDVQRPVVLVGPDCRADDDYETMIVALDGSTHSEAILPIASEYARAMHLRVQLAVVNDGANLLAVDEVLRKAVMVGFDDIEPAAVLRGDVVDALVDAARGKRHALLAMATHGRTGLARVVAGSVTMGVVHRTSVPVLTVRPANLLAQPTRRPS